MTVENGKILTGELVDFDVKVTWLTIAKMYNPFAEAHDITLTTGHVLMIIHEDYGTAATKIAPLLGMEPRSLTRLLKKMEEDQLIVRKDDKDDKRSVRIHLTKKGLEKRRVAWENVHNFNKNIREHVPAKKLEVFFEVINQINQIASQHKLTTD